MWITHTNLKQIMNNKSNLVVSIYQQIKAKCREKSVFFFLLYNTYIFRIKKKKKNSYRTKKYRTLTFTFLTPELYFRLMPLFALNIMIKSSWKNLFHPRVYNLLPLMKKK